MLAALAIVGILVQARRISSLERMFSTFERTERMTARDLAALAEVNEGIQRGHELLKKLNQREVMRARRDDGTYAPMHGANGSDKDALRRRAGLIAGKPAPHK